VRSHMRLAASRSIVMSLWMGMAVTAAVNELPKYCREHDVMSAIGVGFFPVFGAVLIGLGYYPERRTALRILSGAFHPQRST